MNDLDVQCNATDPATEQDITLRLLRRFKTVTALFESVSLSCSRLRVS